VSAESGWKIKYRGGGSHLETDVSGSLLILFRAGLGPLLAIRLRVVDRLVLRLVRLDRRVEDIRPVLDLEMEGVVRLGDFFNSAEDLLLSDVAEGAVLWGGEG
jgi:hypothetical protein